MSKSIMLKHVIRYKGKVRGQPPLTKTPRVGAPQIKKWRRKGGGGLPKMCSTNVSTAKQKKVLAGVLPGNQRTGPLLSCYGGVLHSHRVAGNTRPAGRHTNILVLNK